MSKLSEKQTSCLKQTLKDFELFKAMFKTGYEMLEENGEKNFFHHELNKLFSPSKSVIRLRGLCANLDAIPKKNRDYFTKAMSLTLVNVLNLRVHKYVEKINDIEKIGSELQIFITNEKK
jgi:hypothetical protein